MISDEQYFVSDDGLVWYEPEIDGKKVGIEFGLYGPDTDRSVMADEDYRKRIARSETFSDPDMRMSCVIDANIEHIVSLVGGIRGKDGKRLLIGGKEIQKDDVPQLMRDSPVLRNSLVGYLSQRSPDDTKQLELAVKQYFYLNQQHAEKRSVVNAKTRKKEEKTVYVRNIEKREKFIKQFGQKQFDILCESDESWGKLRDVKFPDGSWWLFSHFIEIWYSCECDFNGNKIFRPRDILDYCECFGVSLTVRERRMLMTMRGWAYSAIADLERDRKKD